MLKVEEKATHTVYSFRGPRSHRRVKVLVQHAWHQRWRESTALKEANARFLRSWVERAMDVGKENNDGLRQTSEGNHGNTGSNSNPPTGDHT